MRIFNFCIYNINMCDNIYRNDNYIVYVYIKRK